jgi:hypothetical protein
VILADCLAELLKNFAMGFSFVRARRHQRSRTGPLAPRDASDLDRFAFGTLNEVLHVVGNVRGLTVLELGPGDHLASGLSFLAAGAKSYTAVEPFPGRYESASANSWYSAVRAAWASRFPQFEWPDALNPLSFIRLPEVQVHECTIEVVHSLKTYDVVCSHYVGQHVRSIDVLSAMTSAHLKRDGVGIHKVGFGPQDCWRAYSDESLFLKVPTWLWSLMGSNRAIPNRRRYHEYLESFSRAGCVVRISNISRFNQAIDATLLAYEFRNMPADSLQIKEATFIVERRV